MQSRTQSWLRAIRWRSGAPKYDFDAPESGQLCRWNGKDYRCGWQAAALDDLIARRSVRREKRDVERDGRTIAGCFVGSVSLDDELVKQGWTVASRE